MDGISPCGPSSSQSDLKRVSENGRAFHNVGFHFFRTWRRARIDRILGCEGKEPINNPNAILQSVHYAFDRVGCAPISATA